jgi:uncharacterized membrane protein
VALDARGYRAHDDVRGFRLSVGTVVPSRLLYLDWLRGIAVLAMVHAHTLDSWTREADRHTQAYYRLQWAGGVASALFLFLAGVATAMSAESKARQADSVDVGARAARRRGLEIFVLAFIFRLQAELLGLGPLSSMLKVDMLNIMGLAMIAAALIWGALPSRTVRAAAFAAATAAVTFLTPLVRAMPLLAALPDPLEAYLRPAGPYSAFALFPWAGYLFAGTLVGELVDGMRASGRNPVRLQVWLAVAAVVGGISAYVASYQPALFPTASFWHDSPTIFFLRLATVAMLVPIAWAMEALSQRAYLPMKPFRAMVTMGRSSLFVYWIHVEMVYGVIAEPIKRTLPLWLDQLAWLAMCVLLYGIVLFKNHLLEGYELPPRMRIFAAVLR